MSKTNSILVFIILVLALGIVGMYIYFDRQDSSEELLVDEQEAAEEVAEKTPEPKEAAPTESSEEGEVISFESHDEYTAPQGEFNIEVNIEGDLLAESSCGGQSCFEEQFASCEAGAYLNLTVTDGLRYYYEIVGPHAGSCKVKSTFLANPNPDWVGKEMTCVYDNTMIFQSAVKAVVENMAGCGCEGPLYQLMSEY